MTDTFMSNWGHAKNVLIYAAWACKPEDRHHVLGWVESRHDAKRVREVSEYQRAYRPRGCAHCHIYFVDDEHPALAAHCKAMGYKEGGAK
jgi:hypothetical protein